MKRLPQIGERVRFRSARLRPAPDKDRECLGTVRKLYPGDRCDEDDPDIIRPVAVGDPDWEAYWCASVEVDDPLPEWWCYSGTNRFAPSLNELEPIT